MMVRIAATLILASQLVLIGVIREPTGANAIWFSFLGHPALGLGILLAILARPRRTRERERH